MVENKPLTPQEVADILKISKSTVYEMIKKKELPAFKIGKKLRIDLQDIERLKNKNTDIKPLENSSPNSAYPLLLNGLPSLYEPTEKVNSFVICGQDALLDILCHYIDRHPKGVRTFRSYEGSYNGLYMLYRGEAQIATAHMWDSKTGQYNVPYIEKMLPGTPAIVIRLASRVQGFYVANGNPKEIKSWEDLTRSDIKIINREKGSGMRILLDEQLRRLGIPGRSINGYNRETFSHLAVASTVARGGADLGFGNEKASLQVQGIDFIPMQTEQYDMIIKKEDMRLPAMEAILEIIRSDVFKLEVSGIGGYDLTETGKIVAET